MRWVGNNRPICSIDAFLNTGGWVQDAKDQLLLRRIRIDQFLVVRSPLRVSLCSSTVEL